MTKSDATQAPVEALETEGLAWLNQLLSGEVTHEQAAAFKAWRSSSSAHEQAFAKAVSLRCAVRRAAKADRAERERCATPSAGRLARRDLLKGAIAASGAIGTVVAGAGASRWLWTDWREWTSDYRTAAGEQRNLAPVQGVSLVLNTRTSVTRQMIDGHSGVELVAGEAAITAKGRAVSPFAIGAGAGSIWLADGAANIRCDGELVRVACLDGAARVRHPAGQVELRRGQEVRYTRRALDPPRAVNPTLAAAWTRGLLIFRDAPLEQVVEELNRYRDGRIVLVGAALARRPIYGVFEIRQIDKAVRQMQVLTGAKVTQLPGNLVVLS